ncbi:MAG: hypothetical protein ACKVVP_23185, partial [Chloroflexota bacterium]
MTKLGQGHGSLLLLALLLADALVLSLAPIEMRLLGCLVLLVLLPGGLLARLLLHHVAADPTFLKERARIHAPSGEAGAMMPGELLLMIGLGFSLARRQGLLLSALAAFGALRPLLGWHVTLLSNLL